MRSKPIAGAGKAMRGAEANRNPVVEPMCRDGIPASKTTVFYGRYTANYHKRLLSHDPGNAWHVVVFAEYRATFEGLDPQDDLHGAQVFVQDQADIVRGSGTHQGSAVITSSHDAKILLNWQGKVSTTFMEDRHSETTFVGSWIVTGSSGRYRNGSGIYKGRIEYPAVFVEWRGVLAA